MYEVTNSDAEAVLKESAQPSGDDGVVMLRGLPFSCTEDDIAHFFSGKAADLSECDLDRHACPLLTVCALQVWT